MSSARWLAVPIEEVATFFPQVKFGKHCETPRHKHQLIPATIFHAVIYADRTDCWISCSECWRAMVLSRDGNIAHAVRVYGNRD